MYPGKRQSMQRKPDSERRRSALLLAASVAAHALLLILIPGLARTAEVPRQLFIELVGEAGLPGHGPLPQSGGPPAPLPGTGAVGVPQPKLAHDPGQPALSSAAVAQPMSIPLSVPAQPKAADAEETQRSGNDATSVVKTEQRTVEKSSEQVPQISKSKDKAPQKPAAKPAPKSSETSKESAPKTESKSNKAEEAKPTSGSESSGPKVNKPSGKAPSKPGESGSDKGSKDGEAGGNGTGGSNGNGGGSNGGGDGGGGTNPGGPPIPVKPLPPPGPSQKELDMLNSYGDAALKRIKGQARNPEVGGEGKVIFEFDVKSNGGLLDVRIIDDAGFELLGNDVLEATRAAFNEAHEKIPFPKDVSLGQWTFRRSIKYPLY
jgi:hypothetical protein